MKTLSSTILLLILATSGICQVSFEPAQYLVYPKSQFQDVVSGDLDNDGDIDMIASTYVNNIQDMYVYLNDGTGGYTLEGLIDSERAGYVMDLADIDEDGDLDLFCASQTSLWWHENTNGSLGGGIDLLPSITDGRCVTVADADGDGDLDIFFCEGSLDRFGLLENLGGVTFAPVILINENSTDANDIVLADLDGDSDMDLVVSCLNYQDVAWYENLGNGNYGPQNLLTQSLTGTKAVIAEDLDGDGDKDIAAASYGTDDVVWFRNLGNGNFSNQILISDQLDGAYDVEAGDIDNDGDMDLVAAASQGDRVWVFLNYGTGNFGSQELEFEAGNAQKAFFNDINNDGFLDLVSLSRDDNKLFWLNGGQSAFSELSYIAQVASYSTVVESADLDNDGDEDLVGGSTGDSKLSLYENKGGGVFDSQKVIDGEAKGVVEVSIGDIDNDGLVDLLVATIQDSTLSWYKNLGGLEFAPRSIIFTGFDQLRGCDLGDMDGDGDLDALYASRFDAQVGGFRNTGSGNFGSKIVLDATVIGANEVKAADIDGDGDLDVTASSEFNDRITWYENMSPGVFSGPQVALSVVDGARDMLAIDLDDDGDLDMVACGFYVNRIFYSIFENGTYGPIIDAGFNVYGPWALDKGDIDGDGDEDVVVTGISENRYVWLEAEDGAFVSKNGVKSVYDRPKDAAVADFNDDGALDVAGAYLHTVSVFFSRRIPDCEVFETAPVDLSDSQPVQADTQDKVVVKWYKESSQIKYSAEDNAACDIEFWAIRDLSTGTPIVGAPHSLLEKKRNPDNDFFKWRLRYSRPDITPNTRYAWRVRCYCEAGNGLVTPWSETDVFNTPDFDPLTGLYIIPGSKSLSTVPDTPSATILRNPVQSRIELFFDDQFDHQEYKILNSSGALVLSGTLVDKENTIDVSSLESGLYLLSLEYQSGAEVLRFMKE